MPPSNRPLKSTRNVTRVLAGAVIFAAGALAAAAFAGPSPAAPKDCPPVIGCISTALPTITLPTVTVPPVTVPTVSVPTVLPTTTSGTGTSPGSTQTSPGSTPNPGTTTEGTAGTPPPAGSPFSARASIRVLGRRDHRVVQITVRLNKQARMTARLTRNGRSLLQRQFSAKKGSRIFRLRVRSGTSAGLARLWLTYRTPAREGAKATFKLRLPR